MVHLILLVPNICGMQTAHITAKILVDLASGIDILIFNTWTSFIFVRVLAGGRARFEPCTEHHRLNVTILQVPVDLWRVHECCLDIYEVSHVLGASLESVSLILLLTETLVHNQTILGDRAILISSSASDHFGCLRLRIIAVLGASGKLDRAIMRAHAASFYRIIRLLMRLQS